MFIIDKENNEATMLDRSTFKDLDLSEVKHLQEWIAKNPTLLGEEEELLIVQKEFRDNEFGGNRPDLIALDESGNLVVIENKLDDSGKDVTWQALRYVSQCSGLTREDIVQKFQEYLTKNDGNDKNATAALCEFFEKDDLSEVVLNQEQRIILVAARFRKEVISTVKWLLKRGIHIKCVRVTPYSHEEKVFIHTEQILPPVGTEDRWIKEAKGRINRTQKIQHDKSKLVFSEIGIQPGEELVHVDDPAIKCTVVDGKQSVEYDGKKFSSLADLCRELGRFEHAAPRLFLYKGKTLRDIRKKLRSERET